MRPTFNPGEIAVQKRAGVFRDAQQVSGIYRNELPRLAKDFLWEQRLVVIASLDDEERPWASLLTGAAGFVKVLSPTALRIDAIPATGDKIAENLKEEADIGLLAFDPATRRRMKVKGHARRNSDGIVLDIDRAYALCPKYIQAREVVGSDSSVIKNQSAMNGDSFTEQQAQMIANADTFFIATHHPETGGDAAHRGGNPGFVRVLSGTELEFPDYSGNNLFNTLGNIQANGKAGLLIPDFDQGNVLQMTGDAEILWHDSETRSVRVTVQQIRELRSASPLRWHFLNYSPFNPVA